MSAHTHKQSASWLGLAAAVPALVIGLAACGSSSSGGSSAVSAGSGAGSQSSGSSSAATSFSTANVSGLGRVVVDGRGRTVYILTASGQKNVPCTDGSGCTTVWPDLPLPDGTSAANAGNGVNAQLLGVKKLSDGETYPTYNGYLMYEYASDSGAGQASGQGIQSYGGTWWALSPAGKPITSSAASGAYGSSGSGGSGYGG